MKNICFFIAFFLLFSSFAHVETIIEVPIIARPVEIQSPLMPQVEPLKKIDGEGIREYISFSLKDVDVNEAIKAIARQTNYNTVIEQDVRGLCTVELKNVTLKKALEYILEPLNYVFNIDDRTIYVSKPKVETRVFPLNYIAMKKTGTSTVTGRIGGTAGTDNTGAGNVFFNLKSTTESDLWQEVDENIKALLSSEGKHAVNRAASVVMVMDYPKRLRSIAQFLEAIEGTAQRQVMIEARIIEVELDKTNRGGINWHMIGTGWGVMNQDIEKSLVKSQTKYFNMPKNSDPPMSPDQYFRFGIGPGKYDAFINLLRTQGKLDIIASPRITTLNNQRAVIKVAEEDVYFDISTSLVPGVGHSSGAVPRFVTVGLILDLTPQIDNIGNIMLNIHPVLTEKTREIPVPIQSSGAGSSTPTKTYVPVLTVREVDALLKIREGESVIIGGLIKERKKAGTGDEIYSMDMAVSGKSVEPEESKTTKSELVIFLTPKVIYGKENP